MRDRLIELLKKEQEARCKYTREKIQEMIQGNLRECLRTGFEFSADYLLENGVIVPPCKVGDTVYRIVVMSTGVTRVVKRTLCPPYKSGVIVNIDPTIKRFIRSVVVTKNNFFDVIENFGKTVFLTKEEAEQALSKLQASYKQVKEGDV